VAFQSTIFDIIQIGDVPLIQNSQQRKKQHGSGEEHSTRKFALYYNGYHQLKVQRIISERPLADN